MSVEPSVAHLAMERMVQASEAECHRSHNGIIPLLVLRHPGMCATVTMANATPPPSEHLFIFSQGMVLLNCHKASSPVFLFWFSNSLILGCT